MFHVKPGGLRMGVMGGGWRRSARGDTVVRGHL
jgi:hypothetical protein